MAMPRAGIDGRQDSRERASAAQGCAAVLALRSGSDYKPQRDAA
jgi:hypothetical protein